MDNIKRALTVTEQVSYLEKYKNVDFSTYGKEEAAEYLLFNNYINVITPFKFYYAKRDPKVKYILVKEKAIIDGKEINQHIYEDKVMFEEYVQRYENERKDYDIMYYNIIKFKSTLKTLITYYLLTGINYQNKSDIIQYINSLKLKNIIKLNVKEETAEIIRKSIDEICELIYSSYNVFKSLYSISFRLTIDLFNVLEESMKIIIFKKMEERNLVYGTRDPRQLHFTMIRIKEIRNAVMHNDSVEIVTRYVNSSYNKNSYRKSRPRQTYEQLIEKLKVNNI